MLLSTRYLAEQLAKIPGVSIRFPAFANELVADFSRTGISLSRLLPALEKNRIFAGVPLDDVFPALKDCLLMCCTEVHEKTDIDRLVKAIYEEVSI